jgi:transposase InsO family protein
MESDSRPGGPVIRVDVHKSAEGSGKACAEKSRAMRTLGTDRLTVDLGERERVRRRARDRSLERHRRLRFDLNETDLSDGDDDIFRVRLPVGVRSNDKDKATDQMDDNGVKTGELEQLRDIIAQAEAEIAKREGLSHEKANSGRPAISSESESDRERVGKWSRERRGRKRANIQLDKYDGTGNFDAYLGTFYMAARYNGWSKDEMRDQLCCSLRGSASHILFLNDPKRTATFDAAVSLLRNRFGNHHQSEIYRARLRAYKQGRNQSLHELADEIRNLTTLGFPCESNSMIEILLIDNFNNALSDRWASGQIRLREPATLDEALKIALKLEALNAGPDYNSDRRPDKPVRVVQTDESQGAVAELTRRLDGMTEEQRQFKSAITRQAAGAEAKMDATLQRLTRQLDAFGSAQTQNQTAPCRDPCPPRRDDRSGNGHTDGMRPGGGPCFSCGEYGHYSRRCPRNSGGGGTPPAVNGAGQGHGNPVGGGGFRPPAANTRKVVSNNKVAGRTKAAHFRVIINGCERVMLADSGSEITVIPTSWVSGLTIHSTTQKLRAANNTEIPIQGELDLDIGVGGYRARTLCVISRHVTEGLIGLDFLYEHGVKLDFAVGQIIIGKYALPLISPTNRDVWCRRIILAQTSVIPARSECELSAETVYRDLNQSGPDWLLEKAEIKPGLLVARALIADRCQGVKAVVLNSTNRPITLDKGIVLGEAEPADLVNPETSQGQPNSDNILPDYLTTLVDNVSSEISEVSKSDLAALLSKYQGIFSKYSGELGVCNLVEHEITTTGGPVRERLRRHPDSQLQKIDDLVDNMVRQGVLERSEQSDWSFNVVLVAKRSSGAYRLCCDLRKLNALTVRVPHPLPDVTSSLEKLKGAKIFSKLDLTDAYGQIQIKEEHRHKVTIMTRKGAFRYRRMPQGLVSSGATFQKMADILLMNLDSRAYSYLDDIICFSDCASRHLADLEEVFMRIAKAGLKVKAEKCHLMQKQIVFLGYVVSETGIHTDPAKTQCVVEWPRPRHLRDVRAFVGTVSYYRRFISGFSALCRPLHELTRKGVKFVWSEACEVAFNTLKEKLVSAPILALPDSVSPWILDTDASQNAIAGVLSQVQNGVERVISYGSRLLSKQERNYCTTKLELLSVVHFVKLYRPYLLGRKFCVRTDHGALTHLWRSKDPIGQNSRWLEQLSQYDFTVQHRRGAVHSNVDGVSRQKCKQCDWAVSDEPSNGPPLETSAEPTAAPLMSPPVADRGAIVNNIRLCGFDTAEIAAAQRVDPELGDVYERMEAGRGPLSRDEFAALGSVAKAYFSQWDRLELREGVLYRRWEPVDGSPTRLQLIPPRCVRQDLIKQAHCGLNAHVGAHKTIEAVRLRAFWVNWTKEINLFCAKCVNCAQYRRRKLPHQTKLRPLLVGEKWSRVSVDICGAFPRSKNGYNYTLTAICEFSKYAECWPIRNKEAATVARVFFENWVCRYGVPDQIMSDLGLQFEGVLFKELCRHLGIEKLRSTPYNPTCNATCERLHGTINNLIGRAVDLDQRNWDEIIPSLMFAYRSTVHTSTNQTPNLLVFGTQLRAPVDVMFGRPEAEMGEFRSYDEFVEDKLVKMEKAFEIARLTLKRCAERRKQYYDSRVRQHEYNVGDWVYYYSPRRYRGRNVKWARNYLGPMLLVKVLSSTNVVLQQTKTSRPFVVHIDKIKKCLSPTPRSWLEGDDVCVDEGGGDDDNEGPGATEAPGGLPADPGVDDGEVTRPRRQTRRPARYND